MIYIGIDPGVKTGFAVWDSDKRQFESIETLGFWTAYDKVICNVSVSFTGLDIKAGRPNIVIEVPSRTMYADKRGNRNTLINIATKYGGTRREAELMAERLESLGFEVLRVRPSRNSGTKMGSYAFKRLTGYEGRTSEHGRDAAMLVFGR